MLNRYSPLPNSIDVASTNQTQGFDLRQTLSFAWRQWKFVASAVAISLVVAGVYLIKQVPLYTATAQILLEQQREKAAGTDAILSENNNLELLPIIESQLAIIRSTNFLKGVVEKENLIDDPEFGKRSSATAETTSSGQGGAEGGTPTPKLSETIEALRTAVTATRVGQGYILRCFGDLTRPSQSGEAYKCCG
jgi:uncharacterized protein involved in exopolysaccharide biosynthesis